MKDGTAYTKRNSDKILADINTKASKYWVKKQQQTALKLFHKAAGNIPAYKEFLADHRIEHSKIKTWKDFQSIPLTNKENYLRKYSLEKLCWNGSLHTPLVYSATSGSTGKPFYFPRSRELDWQQSVLNELFLENSSLGKDLPTLVIITFGMGVWIGGLINYQAFELVSNRGLPISIIAPGVNKEEILKTLRDLAPHYKQTIIVGYPPLVKDIIDDAKIQGIPIHSYNLRFLFAAEAFSETFRTYISKEASVKNTLVDTLNIYGTADIGPMAFETPVSILVRQLANKNKKLFNAIFPAVNKIPTLAQYNPNFITFEASEGNIIVTGSSSIPLIRYSVGDHGGVLSFDELNTMLKDHDIDLIKESARREAPLYKLPFVFIYERSDLSTNLYGIQIYPGYLRDIFFTEPAIKILTGKFTLITKYDESQNQYLEINVELKKGMKQPTLRQKKQMFDIVERALQLKSSEYKELSNHIRDRDLFAIEYMTAENPTHFAPGGKQKWVKKN